MKWNALYQSLLEINQETAEELLDIINQTIEEDKDLLFHDIKKFYKTYVSTFKSIVSEQAIKKGAQFYNLSIKYLSNHDLTLILPVVIDNWMYFFTDADEEIRKTYKDVLKNFVIKTSSLELLGEYIINIGIQSKKFYYRDRTVNIIPHLLNLCRKTLYSQQQGHIVLKLIESVIVATHDNNKTVQQTAISSIYKIHDLKLFNFDQIFKKLSLTDQKTYIKIIDQRKIADQQEKYIKVNVNSLNEQDYESLQSFIKSETNQETNYSADTLNKMFKEYLFQETNLDLSLENFAQDYNGFYFGFLNEEIMKDSLDSKDLRRQEVSIKELHQIINRADKFPVPLSNMPNFFKYIAYLLKNGTVQTQYHLLDIVQILLNQTGAENIVYLPVLFNTLIEFLNNDVINLRRKSMLLFKQILKMVKSKTFAENLLYFLQENLFKYYKWHMQEELLNLFSILVLSTDLENNFLGLDPIKYPKFKSLDIKALMTLLCQYLDNPIKKVRVAALELICVIIIQGNSDSVLSILFELLDSKVYDLINDKLQDGKVYFLNAQNNLEMPMFPIKKFEQKQEEYSKNLPLIIPPIENQEISEEEQSQEELFMLSYYEPKVQNMKYNMSMKDRINKSNINFDALFTKEKEQYGIDGHKYDIVIPVADIKMTQYKKKDLMEESIYNGDHFNKTINHLDQPSITEKNIYLYQRMPEIVNDDNFDYSEFQMNDNIEEKEELFSVDYQTTYLKQRGGILAEPSQNLHESQFNDVKSRVYDNISKLNNDQKQMLQIPKAIDVNVQNYQGYKYVKNDQQSESNSDIFVDLKNIKEQKSETPSDFYDSLSQFMEEATEKQLPGLTDDQKYEKRLQEFLNTFENSNLGNNIRKLNRELASKKGRVDNDYMPLTEKQLGVPLIQARSECISLIMNLRSLNINILFHSINIFRRLLRNHIEILIEPDIPLNQMIVDILNLLSPQYDNPLFQIQKRTPISLDVVQSVILTSLMSLQQCVYTLKRITDIHIPTILTRAAYWINNKNNLIQNACKDLIHTVVRYNDIDQVLDQIHLVLINDSLESKMFISMIVEEIVIKLGNSHTFSKHLDQILKIVALYCHDNDFQIRRQAKKIYFKILDNDVYVDSAITKLSPVNQQVMRDLLQKYKELAADIIIGKQKEQILDAIKKNEVTFKLHDQGGLYNGIRPLTPYGQIAHKNLVSI